MSRIARFSQTARYVRGMAPLFEIRDMTISLTRVPSVSGGVPAEPEERVVIEGASITVDQGEAVALVGESGSGKSVHG